MKQYYRVILFIGLFLSFFASAKQPDLNYEQAFNQEELYQQHAAFFDMLSFGENVNLNFENTKEARSNREEVRKEWFEKAVERLRQDPDAALSFTTDTFVAIRKDSTYDEWLQQTIKGHEAALKVRCLQQLEWERTKAKYQPVLGLLYKAAVMVGIAYAAPSVLGDSVALAADASKIRGVSVGLYSLKEVAEQVPSLLNSSNDPIKELEELFAINKCYIPNGFWPRIIKAFILAHKDELNRAKYIDYLDYTLGFTVHKPKPYLPGKDNQSICDIKQELDIRIDRFFKDYECDTSTRNDSLQKLKLNVSKFVDSLYEQRGITNPIYLHGPGGVGKTYFVKQLSEWIDELVPEAVMFENFVVDSADRLEGNADQAGIFLNVLRNQLVQRKHGSLVMLDEASWLVQRPDMTDAIKRTFDAKNSKILARFGGSDMQGPVKVTKPNMLVVLAGNLAANKIQDKALASRFLPVTFPAPRTAVLVDYASHILQNSHYVDQKIKSTITKNNIIYWVQSLPASDRNFRYIEQNVEVSCTPALLAKRQNAAKELLSKRQHNVEDRLLEPRTLDKALMYADCCS